MLVRFSRFGFLLVGLAICTPTGQTQNSAPSDEMGFRRLLPLLNREGVAYCKATLSADGNILALVTDQQTLQVYNLQSQVCLLSLNKHPRAIDLIACSPDGCRVAVGSHDPERITVWDTAQLQEPVVLQRKETYPKRLSVLRFGSNDCLAASYSDGVALWSIPKRTMTKPVKADFLIHFITGDFLTTNSRMIVAGKKTCALLSRTGEITPFATVNDGVFGVDMDPKGRSLVVGDCRGRMHVWGDITSPHRPDSLDISNMGVLFLHCSPNGAELAIMDGKGRLSVWDRKTYRQVFAIQQPDISGPLLFRYALGGKILLYVGKTVRIFHAEDGTEIELPVRRPH